MFTVCIHLYAYSCMCLFEKIRFQIRGMSGGAGQGGLGVAGRKCVCIHRNFLGISRRSR